jgi:hypothetical protein
VQVQIGRTRFEATGAEIGPDDADYARLLKLVNDNNGNRHDAYQKKTTRPIPLVALRRTARVMWSPAGDRSRPRGRPAYRHVAGSQPPNRWRLRVRPV